MKKEVKITFIIENEKLRSNDEIKENLAEMIFDEFAREEDIYLQNIKIIVKDILK